MSVNQQISHQKQMLAFVNYCKTLNKDVTLSAIQLKLSQIIKLNEEFEVNQVNMEEACTTDKEIDVQITLRSQFSDQYYYCYVTLQERIIEVEDAKALANQNQGNVGAGANRKKEVKLPKIELTQFAGDYEDWATFHDLFHSLIHTNDSIDDVQKLQYLKSNLQGNAETLLRPYTITNANYAEAWKKLKSRYNHKRFIVDGLLKKFFNQPMVRNENASEIKQLIDKSSEIVQSLQLQGVPVAQWDVILVHVVVSKLDVETHKQWELLQKKDELAKFEALEEFLENRWQSLEMVQKDSGHSQSRQSVSQKFPRNSVSSSSENFRQRSEINCYCCKELNHKLYGCPKYSQLSVTQRKEILKVNKLCFNCLSSGHSIVDCSNLSRCKDCNGKHHSSIHIEIQDSSWNNQQNALKESQEDEYNGLGQTKTTFITLKYKSLDDGASSLNKNEEIQERSRLTINEQLAMERFWKRYDRRCEVEATSKKETSTSKDQHLDTSHELQALEESDATSDMIEESSAMDSIQEIHSSVDTHDTEESNKQVALGTTGTFGALKSHFHERLNSQGIRRCKFNLAINSDIVKEFIKRRTGFLLDHIIDQLISAKYYLTLKSFYQNFEFQVTIMPMITVESKIEVKSSDSISPTERMQLNPKHIFFKPKSNNAFRYSPATNGLATESRIVDWYVVANKNGRLKNQISPGQNPNTVIAKSVGVTQSQSNKCTFWSQKFGLDRYHGFHFGGSPSVFGQPKYYLTEKLRYIGLCIEKTRIVNQVTSLWVLLSKFIIIHHMIHFIHYIAFHDWSRVFTQRDKETVPAKWPVARVLKVYPDEENKVRVVKLEKHKASIKGPIPRDFSKYLAKLKTHKSTFKRPVSKISLLPIEDNNLI